MATVREMMESNLWVIYGMEEKDIHQAMPVIIQKTNLGREIQYDSTSKPINLETSLNNHSRYYNCLEHKDNPEKRTPFKDCWGMNKNFFTEDSLEDLFQVVKNHALRWCVDKMHSMK